MQKHSVVPDDVQCPGEFFFIPDQVCEM